MQVAAFWNGNSVYFEEKITICILEIFKTPTQINLSEKKFLATIKVSSYMIDSRFLRTEKMIAS